jgi:hypothetical protein
VTQKMQNGLPLLLHFLLTLLPQGRTTKLRRALPRLSWSYGSASSLASLRRSSYIKLKLEIKPHGSSGKHDVDMPFFYGSCINISHLHTSDSWLLSLNQWQKQDFSGKNIYCSM